MTNQLEALSMVLEQLLQRLSATEAKAIPEYMTTTQAAAYLGVSKQYLEIARCYGHGPRYIKLTQAVRYHKADLDTFMNAHRKQHTAEGGSNGQ